ncbi:MAG TPA: RnfABCDGE type electron transport complex subunit D [Patescibacteria group bacterium]|nr:RnfABCDGE type electron transport complex subunit D [Patescibacteria group bacterium]
MTFIDNFLNRITMYRLVLYYLAALYFLAIIFAFFHFLPYSPLAMIFHLAFLLAVSWMTNEIFARYFKEPVNVESSYITAYILALIITPLSPQQGISYLIFLLFAAIWSIASKFLVAVKGKHIFNPAALSVFLTAILVNLSASWWVGNAYLVIPVFLGGYLIVRKIRRWDMIISFFLFSFLAIFIPGILKGTAILAILTKALFYSPLFFFAFIMLTEPLTTPSRKWGRIFYGALVGILFSPAIHFGSFYTTPEIALLLGNFFSYLISPKQKLILQLERIDLIGDDLFELVFSHRGKFKFRPGQYLEWTMAHNHPDRSGTRRYFTIASAPTEQEIRIGIKYNQGKSSYKRALLSMKKGDKIFASQLAGDFTLPKSRNKKLVFIAGGIGITPFRSMVKYIIDKNERRDIVLFYSCKLPEEITYKNIFDSAQNSGVKTVYTLTDKQAPEIPWCYRGRLDARIIEKEVPDYSERIFFISGPNTMVEAYKKMLHELGINSSQIKTDYFPGFV